MGEEPRGPYLGLHVRQLERYGLVLGYGLAEGRPLRRVFRGVQEGGFGDTQGLRGDPDPAEVQRSALRKAPCLGRSRSSSGTKTLSRSTSSVVAEMTPIFCACLPNETPSASMETTKAVRPRGAGEGDHGAGDAAVRNPLLVAREPVAAFDPLGGRLYRGRVGACSGLGEGEGPDLVSLSKIRHPPRLLVLIPVHHDRERTRASVDSERRRHQRRRG